MAKAVSEVSAIGPVSNGAVQSVKFEEPYIASVGIVGTAALLFHRWNVESIKEKSGAAKGSQSKKTDDVESYVMRTADGEIGIPGTYLRGALVNAARWVQDPRSPRKSAMDLFKAGVVVTTECASLGAKNWDYLDQQHVTVMRAGITRVRPAFHAGWKAEFEIQILTPEYITPDLLSLAITRAGVLVGVGDFRPTYGRFRVSRFDCKPLM